MKTLITIFSLLLWCNSSFSQERLTSIESKSANAHYFAEMIDGVRYLLETDLNDNLNVSVLNDDYTLNPLHSKFLKGSFFNYQTIVEGKLIYTFDDNTPVIYNYVDDTEVRFDIPSEWYPDYWRAVRDSLALLRVSSFDNEEYKYFLVNNEGDILSEEESLRYVVNLYPNYFFKLIVPEPDENYSYYLENIETGVKDTIMHQISRDILTEYNDEVIYLDEHDDFYRFNLVTGEKIKIPNVSFSSDDVWSIKVIDDFLFVQNSVSFGKYIIYMYNLETGILEQFFDHDNLDDFNLKESYIAQGKLVVNDRSNLVILDIETGYGQSYSTGYGSDVRVPLLDERYIFNTNYWTSSFIDLKDGTETVVSNEDEIYPYDYTKVIPMNGSFLGVIGAIGPSDKSLFKLNVENKTFEHVSSIDNTNEGLYSYDTEILKFGKNIVLATNDIYSVNGTEVTKINPYELIEIDFSFYEIHNDHITFVCKNGIIGQYIYSYDGETLTEEAFIPNTNPFPLNEPNILQYKITDDHVFYIDGIFFNSNLVIVEKSTGDKKEINDPNFYFFEIELFQSENDIYIDFQDEVFHIDEEGDIISVVSYEDADFNKAGLLTYNGICYNLGNSDVSILKGNSTEIIYSSEEEFDRLFNLSSSFAVSQFISDNESKVILVEGQNATELEFEYRLSRVLKASDNHYIFTTQHNETKEQRLYIFNGNTDELFNVSELMNEQRILGLRFRNGTPYLFTYNFNVNRMFVNSLDENYLNSTSVYEAGFYGGFLGTNLINVGDLGMLYLGRELGVVEETFSVKKMNVHGHGGMTGMVVNEEGYVYFIGADVIFGNQLFRFDPSDFISSIDEEDKSTNIKVFPNPFQDFITLDKRYIGMDYEVLNQRGRIIKSGSIKSNGLNLNQMTSGLYYLKIDDGNTIYSTPIYKK